MGGRDRPRLASRLTSVPGCPSSPRRTCYTAHENRVPTATAAEDNLAASHAECSHVVLPDDPARISNREIRASATGRRIHGHDLPHSPVRPSARPLQPARFRPPPTGNSRYTASPGQVVSHKTRRRSFAIKEFETSKSQDPESGSPGESSAAVRGNFTPALELSAGSSTVPGCYLWPGTFSYLPEVPRRPAEMSLAQLKRLLPLPDEELKQFLDYATTLSKSEAAEHFGDLLGDSPQAVEFISSFNSRRQDTKNPAASAPSSNNTSPPEPAPKASRAPKKKKTNIHTPAARRVEDSAPPPGASYSKKNQEDDYYIGRKPNQAAESSKSGSSASASFKQPPKSQTPPPPQQQRTAGGYLISDVKAKPKS
ncbi:hypothetical protein CMUS01_01318, partial [Colletotrichum musicola]